MNGSVVLGGNHTSNLDCLLLISSTKRKIHFLAKDSLIKGKFGFIFKNMGIIPVNRSHFSRRIITVYVFLASYDVMIAQQNAERIADELHYFGGFVIRFGMRARSVGVIVRQNQAERFVQYERFADFRRGNGYFALVQPFKPPSADKIRTLPHEIQIENFHAAVCVFFYGVIFETRRVVQSGKYALFVAAVLFVKFTDATQVGSDAFTHALYRSQLLRRGGKNIFDTAERRK